VQLNRPHNNNLSALQVLPFNSHRPHQLWCAHVCTCGDITPVLMFLCRPDKDRFHRPYIHTMSVADRSGQVQQVSLTIKQQKFSSEGFASTGWWGW
jgi:hypothetical protein